MHASHDTRQWWREWLGATEDPAGTWHLGPVRPHSVPCPRGSIQQLTLRSYGSELVAELFRPDNGQGRPLVVVPFYEAPSVLGVSTPRTVRHGRDPWSRAHGLHLAQRGLNVLAVPWWFEQIAAADAETAKATSLSGRYDRGAALHRTQLDITALGRSIADLMLAVTALLDEGLATRGSIAAFGHSLGGKLALHLAALDLRIDAAAAHEPGLGFAFSNWDDPWYLGSQVPTDRDQDELLALVAPRPFLLAGGGAGDGAHNRHLADSAAMTWPDPTGLSLLYHAGGHPLPQHITAAVAAWLEERLS